MRGATLDVQEMVGAMDRLASLCESWFRGEIWTKEVAEGLVNTLEELGMTLETSDALPARVAGAHDAARNPRA